MQTGFWANYFKLGVQSYMSAHVVARFGRVMWWCALSLAAFGVLFRSLIWASWVPLDGDPYGAADILELLIWYLVLGSCAICLRDLRLARKLLVTALLLPVVYYFAYSNAPIYQLWGQDA